MSISSSAVTRAFHGYPRFTGDIDFFVAADEGNARGLMAVLADFGFGGLGIDVAALTRPHQIVQLGLPPNRIDLLTSISGVEFAEAWRSRIAGELDGLPVFYIGREALLANKLASGRPRDLADAHELERRRT